MRSIHVVVYLYHWFFSVYCCIVFLCADIPYSSIHQLNGGFPHSSVSKESAWNAGDLVSIPGLGRSLGEGNGNPLQYSCLKNPMERGAWQATVHGVARVGHDLVTKPPSHHHHLKDICVAYSVYGAIMNKDIINICILIQVLDECNLSFVLCK